MNKFWGWMVEKGYCVIEFEENVKMTWILDENDDSCVPTKQMLIGYMMEYLNDVAWKWWFSNWDEQVTTEQRYVWLKSKIESLTPALKQVKEDDR